MKRASGGNKLAEPFENLDFQPFTNDISDALSPEWRGGGGNLIECLKKHAGEQSDRAFENVCIYNPLLMLFLMYFYYKNPKESYTMPPSDRAFKLLHFQPLVKQFFLFSVETYLYFIT